MIGGEKEAIPATVVATAASYYYNGDFGLAATEFSHQLDGNRKNRDREHLLNDLPTSLDAWRLSTSAFEADAAICRARAVLCDPKAQKTDGFSACRQALDANGRYRRALRVAAVAAPEDPLVRDYVSGSTLLAGIAASWLCLKLDQVPMAYQVATEAIQWSASYLATSKSSHLEVRMWPVTEAMQFLACHMPNQKAVRAMNHSLRVLSLSRNIPASSSSFWAKTCRYGDDGTNCQPTDLVELRSKPELQFHMKEQLVHALSLDRFRCKESSFHLNSRALRNEFLQRAVSAEKTLSIGQLADRVQAEIRAMECIQVKKKVKAEDLNSLGKSLGPSSLGLIRANCGELELALDAFQQALKIEEGIVSHRVNISNAAECLLCLGIPGLAKELFLHSLQTPIDLFLRRSSETKIHLSADPAEDKTLLHDDTGLLWRLFLAATLEPDWATAAAVAEKLYRNAFLSEVARDCATCAYVFVLLQGHRPSLALDICRKEAQRTENFGSATTLALLLYEADAAMVTQTGFSDSLAGNSNGVSSIVSLTSMARTHYDRLSPDAYRPSMELLSVICNNEGISLLLQGKSMDALVRFREAVRVLSCLQKPNSDFDFLQPFFNLALLQWRNGKFVDAIQVWLPARGLATLNEDMEETSDLTEARRALGAAMDQYHQFKQNNSVGTPHASTWQSGNKKTFLGGMDAFQVRLMDILMLQCAIELASHRAVSSYVGYM